MRNFKILYAEDDETLAFLTKDNLEQNNYEVIHCCDGQSGLETFKKEIPTLFDYSILTSDPIKASNSDNFLIKIKC